MRKELLLESLINDELVENLSPVLPGENEEGMVVTRTRNLEVILVWQGDGAFTLLSSPR